MYILYSEDFVVEGYFLIKKKIKNFDKFLKFDLVSKFYM